MLLHSILKDIHYTVVQGEMDKNIVSISFNSNKMDQDGVFVAIVGFSVDGHKYIDDAISKGATVVVVEEGSIVTDKEVTVIKVDNTRKVLAKMACNFYENPTENMNLVGITGTNGKTSISYFLKAMFEEVDKDVGIIGTMGNIVNDTLIESNNTTPESLDLQSFFSELARDRINNCVMEVSSHALALDRTAYSQFDAGIFTNLTPDHLELHKTMEEYFLAKAKLFYQTDKVNIINIDDEYGKRLAQLVQDQPPSLLTYGIDHSADIYATNIEYDIGGTTYTVNTPTESFNVTVHIPGKIYVYNSLAAIAYAYWFGISTESIISAINKVANIKGRLEEIYRNDDYRVIIDFAHTEDALKKTIETIHPYIKGRLILVFGVYADMSDSGKDKRVGMGEVAAKYADISIVTSDNPKYFDQQTILDQITNTIKREHGIYFAVLDRKEAIEYAINISKDNDVILLTGKGHENTQVINGVEAPFNEREIVHQALTTKKHISS